MICVCMCVCACLDNKVIDNILDAVTVEESPSCLALKETNNHVNLCWKRPFLFVFKDKDVRMEETSLCLLVGPLEDDEAETLIKDQSLCLLSCVPQQLLQHISPFLLPPTPLLLQWQAHSLTLLSACSKGERSSFFSGRVRVRGAGVFCRFFAVNTREHA